MAPIVLPAVTCNANFKGLENVVKNQNRKYQLSVLAVALAGAFASMQARADDAEAAALKTPANTVEIGVANTSNGSQRFGEYNGLEKGGASFVGGFNLRGGSSYGGTDSGGTSRWSLYGTDLGLTTRNLGGTVSDQGQWNLGLTYDQLQHNFAPGYQTPYQGNMGGNTFVLPSGFGVTNNTNTMTPAQRAAFHNVDVDSDRKNTSLTAGVILSPNWSLKFDFNHLDQSGAKLMGFGSAGTGGSAGERTSILPNPTNYKTDSVTMAVNWLGEKGNATVSYYGSFFRDGYDRVNFMTWGTANIMDSMSTAPSNNFHQLNFSGGWAFSPRTKLATNLSYGRNTQNAAFVVDSFMAGPVAATAPGNRNGSLNGLVVNTHADLKLTDQTTKNLVLSGALKYDERDNRTASNIYNYFSLDGSTNTNYPNTPLSTKKDSIELAGDYAFKRDHHLRLAYVHEDIKRWCNQYAVGGYTGPAGSLPAGVLGYPPGTNCVVNTGSREDKLDAAYRIKLFDTVGLKLGYVYSDRDSQTDPRAIAAFSQLIAGLPTGSVPGQNANDFLGFQPFFEASRKEQLYKAGLNWDATEALNIGISARYTDDNYGSTYGVQKGHSWSANLDASYRYTDNGTVSTYLTRQNRYRSMTNEQRVAAAAAASATAVATPSGATWSNTLADDSLTVGLGAKHTGLLNGKLELSGDANYSWSKTGYDTVLNYSTFGVCGAAGGITCASPTILSCGALPDIKTGIVQLKMLATYQFDKKSKVALRYLYSHLTGGDYYYSGLQMASTPNAVMPTNQQLGNYSLNVIALSYIHTF